VIVTCFLLRDQQLTISQLHNDGCRLPRLNNQGDASFATCELADSPQRRRSGGRTSHEQRFRPDSGWVARGSKAAFYRPVSMVSGPIWTNS
jgi:hypothetical protein